MPILDRPKYEKFAQEYAKSGNLMQSAITAGYSKVSASPTAARLIRNKIVLARIDEIRAKNAKKYDITHEKILQELANVAFMDVKDCVEIDADTGAIRAKGWDEMPEGASRAISEVSEDRIIKENADGTKCTVNSKIKMRRFDKVRALQILNDWYKAPALPPQTVIVVNGTDPQAPQTAAACAVAYQQMLSESRGGGKDKDSKPS